MSGKGSKIALGPIFLQGRRTSARSDRGSENSTTRFYIEGDSTSHLGGKSQTRELPSDGGKLVK